MTVEQADPNRVAQQPVYFTVFHLLGLIMAAMCAFFLARAGWAEGGLLGFLGAVLLAALLAPIVFGAVTVLSFLGLGSFAFIACDEIPLGLWLTRLRTVLRGAVIVGSIAWVGYSAPGLIRATTWKEFYDAALLGLLLPFSSVFSLYMSRFERLSEPGKQGENARPVPPTAETSGD